MDLRFGDCVLDSASRELRRAGERVDLAPKAYELLSLLLERRPAAVSKGEIHERLWPRTFISEVGLARLVCELRAAIGDDARRPRHLRTVRGFGYAFSAAVEATATRESGALRLVWSGREFPLRPGANVIGRSGEADLFLDASRVSRRHARIFVSEAEATVEDLGSKNGTFLQGTRIQGREPLTDGDEIRVGSVSLRFRGSLRPASTEPASSS